MSDILYCDVCDITLSSIYTLRKHLKTNLHKRKQNPVRKFSCICGKEYNHRQNLHAHRKKCEIYKNPPVQEDVREPEPVPEPEPVQTHISQEPLMDKIVDLEKKLLEEKIDKLQLQHENDQMQLENLKNKLEIAELKEKFTKVTNNNNNNNNDNSKNKTVNITNITVNEFGSEKKEYISLKKKIQYIKEIYKCIPKYLEELHFNPNHPENQNVKWPNKKEDFCQVIENSKWVYKDKDDTYTKLKDQAFDELSGTYREHINRFEPRKQDRFEEFIEKYEAENKKLNKDLDKDIDILFLEAKNNLK